MEKLAVTCLPRQDTGKGAARKLRQRGMIPGILYGGDDVAPVTVDPKDILEVLSSHAGENAIIDLNVSGEKRKKERKVILRDIQYDTVKGHLIHVDLYEISMDEELEVDVPIELVGVPAGADHGGILTQLLQEITIKCLPDKIPDKFVLDVSRLEIGDSLHVSNLTIPEGVAVLDDLEAAVANIAAPRVEEVPAEEVVEEAVAGEAAGEKEGEEKPTDE